MNLEGAPEGSEVNAVEMDFNVECQSLKNVVASKHPPISCPDGITIPELIWSNLHLKEKRVAMECALTGKKMTFGEIYKESRSFGAALIQIGLKHGETVNVILPNILEFAAIALGALDAGGVVAPTNPLYTTDEMIDQFVILKSKFAITTPTYLSIVQEVMKRCLTLKTIIIVGEPQEGCHTYSEMIKVDPGGYTFLKGAQINTRKCVALIPFSSGTTGLPKGVELTHFNICANVRQFLTPGCAYMNSVDRGEEQERSIAVLPFFHSYGFVAILGGGMVTGQHLLCVQKFEPHTFVKYFCQFKPHVLTLVPPIIGFLIHSPDVRAEDFEQVRCIQTGAAPLGSSLATQLIEKTGKEIFVQNMYGLTEASPGTMVLNPKFGNSKIGSCGSLYSDSFAKIVDIDTGKALGPNQIGEFCIKGPQVMKGYYQNDEATRQTIDSDGWLHSGDVAYYDEDECFFVVDRIKELIKVSGFQVAPAELEDLLRLHPQVADVAVIGIPDEKHGEVPRAYIVRKSEDLSEVGVLQFLSGKIAKHKKIRGGIEFIKIIPKASSGKILRRELKKDFIQKKV